MAKYYYNAHGVLHEVDLTVSAKAKWVSDENPELMTKSQVSAEDLKEMHNRSARENRRAEYPPASDALDALAKWAYETDGLPAELKAWAEACKAVKDKYPLE